MKSKEKKTKWRWVGPLFGALALVGGALLWMKLEGETPGIRVSPETLALGVRSEITVSVTDAKSGVSSIRVGIVKDGKEQILLEERFPSAGFFSTRGVREKTFTVAIEPKKLGFSDGTATLRFTARDHSWRHWFHGNPAYLEKEVTVDTRPPQIIVMSRFHYLNQGGTGLVVYRLTEPCPETGVRVAERFFPGYGGYSDDPGVHVAFFALGHEQGPGTAISIQAVDAAGNSTRSGFPYQIKPRRFRKDAIALSDAFLTQILPKFEAEIGGGGEKPLIERFLQVNRDLRKKNYEAIVNVTSRSEKMLLWDGAFLRLPNSENRAGFADSRDYIYLGKKVDEQVHLGVDLAATAHAPVPSANRGKVVFSGNLGIYGLTLIVDHGFGVFSMYSHLSDYTVSPEQTVEKGEIIGHTGDTGLAGGDHLHFGMVIHDTFVHPVEWWDPLWIEKRITAKLKGTENG